MILQCRVCAGNITAVDEDLRQGMVTCDYCHTVSRITDQGLEANKKRVLESYPQHGINVRRGKSGVKISVSAGIGVRSRADGIFFVAILVGALAAGVLIWYVFRRNENWPIFCCGSALLMFFALFLLLTERHPYLLLHDGILESSHTGLTKTLKIPITEIEQLYVTTNRIIMNDSVMIQHDLFVLNKTGNRVRIFGDFSTVERALLVEELLEIELGIFNLPVYGEVNTTTADVVAFQEKPDEQIQCYACAAHLQVSKKVRQRGYITCEHCHTVTLFYTKTSHQPILGQPNAAQMTFDVICNADKAWVLWKNEKKGVLLLEGNHIAQSTEKMVQGFNVERFSLQEITVSRNPVKIDIDLLTGKIEDQFEQSLAYSEDETISYPINYVKQFHYNFKYVIGGQIDGRWRNLVPALDDLREAAFIVTKLNNYLDEQKAN